MSRWPAMPRGWLCYVSGKTDSASFLRPLLWASESANCLSGLKKTCFFLKILLNQCWLFQGHSGTSLYRWQQMETHKPWRWEQADIRNAFRKQPLEHAFWSLRSWSSSFGSTMFAIWSWSIRRRSPPTSWNLGSITRCKLSLRTE